MNDKKIVYFRIQDHLRGMGLGRQALKKLAIHIQEKYNLNLKDLTIQVKLDKDALKNYKYRKDAEKPDLFDKELQKTDPDKFEQMLSSVIIEIRSLKFWKDELEK